MIKITEEERDKRLSIVTKCIIQIIERKSLKTERVGSSEEKSN